MIKRYDTRDFIQIGYKDVQFRIGGKKATFVLCCGFAILIGIGILQTNKS